MKKVPLTSDLSLVRTPVALVDASGKVVGHYFPKPTLDEFEPVGGWPTDEELEAAANQPGPRYTTAEVIAHLRSLG